MRLCGAVTSTGGNEDVDEDERGEGAEARSPLGSCSSLLLLRLLLLLLLLAAAVELTFSSRAIVVLLLLLLELFDRTMSVELTTASTRRRFRLLSSDVVMSIFSYSPLPLPPRFLSSCFKYKNRNLTTYIKTKSIFERKSIIFYLILQQNLE